VYFQIIESPIKYPNGNSRIVYIGKCGKETNKSEGLKTPIDFIIYWFGIGKYDYLKPKSNTNTSSVYFINFEIGIDPLEIEEAFIYAFKKYYGVTPKGNNTGKGFTEDKLKKVETKYGVTLESLIKTLKFFEME
jgi:hypothetical protein